MNPTALASEVCATTHPPLKPKRKKTKCSKASTASSTVLGRWLGTAAGAASHTIQRLENHGTSSVGEGYVHRITRLCQSQAQPQPSPAQATWSSGTKAAGATTKSPILNCSPGSTVQVKQSKKGRRKRKHALGNG